MPIYSIENTKTKEMFEIVVPFRDLEPYLLENPDHRQVFNKFPGIGDSVRLGKTRVDDNFKDVLRTVKSHHKHSTIDTL